MPKTVFELGHPLYRGGILEKEIGLSPVKDAQYREGSFRAEFVSDGSDDIFLLCRDSDFEGGSLRLWRTLSDRYGNTRLFLQLEDGKDLEAFGPDDLGRLLLDDDEEEMLRHAMRIWASEALHTAGDPRRTGDISWEELDVYAREFGVVALSGTNARLRREWPQRGYAEEVLERQSGRAFVQVGPPPVLESSGYGIEATQSDGRTVRYDLGRIEGSPHEVFFSACKNEDRTYVRATGTAAGDETRLFLESSLRLIECFDYRHASEHLRWAIRKEIPKRLARDVELNMEPLISEASWPKLADYCGIGIANGTIVDLNEWPTSPSFEQMSQLISERDARWNARDRTEDYRMLANGFVRTMLDINEKTGTETQETYRKSTEGLLYERTISEPCYYSCSYRVVEENGGGKRYFRYDAYSEVEFKDWDHADPALRDDMKHVLKLEGFIAGDWDARIITEEEYRTAAMEAKLIMSESGLRGDISEWPEKPVLARHEVKPLEPELCSHDYLVSTASVPVSTELLKARKERIESVTRATEMKKQSSREWTR